MELQDSRKGQRLMVHAQCRMKLWNNKIAAVCEGVTAMTNETLRLSESLLMVGLRFSKQTNKFGGHSVGEAATAKEKQLESKLCKMKEWFVKISRYIPRKHISKSPEHRLACSKWTCRQATNLVDGCGLEVWASGGDQGWWKQQSFSFCDVSSMAGFFYLQSFQQKPLEFLRRCTDSNQGTPQL